MSDLFGKDDGKGHDNRHQPLATRMRPMCLEDVAGQEHLVAPGKSLYQMFTGERLHSFILWGPPGSGKTTLARIAGQAPQRRFVALSAVLSGVKDIQKVIQEARRHPKQCVLFIDEVHRFNKAQQDAFLPEVESGLLTLIGATTENPSFEINNALLSRVRVYVLHRLKEDAILKTINRALTQDEEIKHSGVKMSDDVRSMIAKIADGDARVALNLIELSVDIANSQGLNEVSEELVQFASGKSLRHFDAKGELWYDLISALHKSIRGSDPDASLYYLARMLDGGCDPLYIVRRLVRFASEDIGNADKHAWDITLNAWMTYERLGSPEGELALAHAVTYLACAPKSNAVYTAFKSASAAVKEHGHLEVPLHLRNAPTRLMKGLGYGDNYRYAHEEPNAFAAGETYFPEEIKGSVYYTPSERGDEAELKKRLDYFKQLNRTHGSKPRPEKAKAPKNKN